ncbi:hypothetical protein OH76DRAFT_1175230 [Lentinus brumalis]|uniref:Uncharacterized protein n=1 Tax=Lentinus brumalis TaxID=2498619 RepID=A0A371CU32_9APHY|nr:hypothetical protein OH76DRAFT_1175230 [Polyporus brumalis]
MPAIASAAILPPPPRFPSTLRVPFDLGTCMPCLQESTGGRSLPGRIRCRCLSPFLHPREHSSFLSFHTAVSWPVLPTPSATASEPYTCRHTQGAEASSSNALCRLPRPDRPVCGLRFLSVLLANERGASTSLALIWQYRVQAVYQIYDPMFAGHYHGSRVSRPPAA